MLFDVIQVCEISLSVTSRQQFDAWLHGPLNSLIPHSGLLVWAEGNGCEFGDLKLLHVCTSLLGQPISNEDDRSLSAELMRQWCLADRIPLLLDPTSTGFDQIRRIPAGLQVLVDGTESLFGDAGSLFALFCKKPHDQANTLFMAHLIAPYLRLAVDRIYRRVETPEWGPRVVSIPTPSMALTAREIGVLECIRDRTANAEIGAVLNISPFTVKSHLRRVFRKLDASTRAQAVASAISQRILGHRPQRSAFLNT